MEQGPFINGVELPIQIDEACAGELFEVATIADHRLPNQIVRMVSVVDADKIRVYLEKNSAGVITYQLTKEFDEYDKARDYAELILSPVALAEKLLDKRLAR